MVQDFNFTAIVACAAFLAYAAAFVFKFRFSGVNWLESHHMSALRNMKRKTLAKNAVYIGAAFTWASSLSLFWIQHENPAVGLPVSVGATVLIAMALWLATSLAGRAIIAPVVVASAVYAAGSYFQDTNVLVGVIFGIFIGACVTLLLSGVAAILAASLNLDATHDYDWLGCEPTKRTAPLSVGMEICADAWPTPSAQILAFDPSRRPDKKG